jgi:hypothetical protein
VVFRRHGEQRAVDLDDLGLDEVARRSADEPIDISGAPAGHVRGEDDLPPLVPRHRDRRSHRPAADPPSHFPAPAPAPLRAIRVIAHAARPDGTGQAPNGERQAEASFDGIVDGRRIVTTRVT